MDRRWLAALVLAIAGGTCAAQDTERGRRLFVDTRGATGKPVGNCGACQATGSALRVMIATRGGRADDARSVRRVLQRSIEGAHAGARGAKAQYRGVLTNRDLDDLAAYIAKARAT
jgi:cytochrome c553